MTASEKLAERTEYERWILEAVYALVEQELFPVEPDSIIYPVGKSTPHSFAYGRSASDDRRWQRNFLKVGAPLVFVTIFKLLDMFIEWTIEEHSGNTAPWQFKKELEALNSTTFPQLVQSRPWLRERLVGLYEHLAPLRGTIVHDRRFHLRTVAFE